MKKTVFTFILLMLFTFPVYAGHMTRNTSDRGRIFIPHSETVLIEAERAREIVKKAERKAAAARKAAARVVALAKLKAFGLTDEEIDSLFK